jgi:hypothetical protein
MIGARDVFKCLPENLLNGCETLGASVYDKKELDGLDPVM